MPPAGMLNQRLKLMTPTWETSPTGQPVASYPPPPEGWPKIWASVKQVSFRNVMRGQQVVEIGTYRVVIRWRKGLDRYCRFLYRGQVLEIVSIVNETQRHGSLELMCVALEGDTQPRQPGNESTG